MAGRVKPSVQASATGPDDVRGDVLLGSKDEAWGKVGFTRPGLFAPELENKKDPSAHALMMPTRLFGHVKIASDDLIACIVHRIGECFEITGGIARYGAHAASFSESWVSLGSILVHGGANIQR